MTLTNGYCNVAELKIELGINDDTDNDRLEISIGAASRQIDFYTGLTHGFWVDSAVTTREFYSDDVYGVTIPDGISTTTGLIIKLDPSDNGTWSTTVSASDYQLSPINALDSYPVRPWTQIALYGNGPTFNRSGYGRPNVQITAKFGWPETPADVKKACLIQSALLFKASDAVTGALQLGEGYQSFSPGGGWMNPTARSLLEGYCLPRVG